MRSFIVEDVCETLELEMREICQMTLHSFSFLRAYVETEGEPYRYMHVHAHVHAHPSSGSPGASFTAALRNACEHTSTLSCGRRSPLPLPPALQASVGKPAGVLYTWALPYGWPALTPWSRAGACAAPAFVRRRRPRPRPPRRRQPRRRRVAASSCRASPSRAARALCAASWRGGLRAWRGGGRGGSGPSAGASPPRPHPPEGQTCLLPQQRGACRRASGGRTTRRAAGRRRRAWPG
mmetsp:Transcript_323/g.1122  ORF Transcript_323/g.1122 Transcript_323/m.1122 type:complete len:237 (+) Transcript_323:546-1256(+)